MVADPAGVGRILAGRYTLRSQLGRGGMGTVWLASDEVLGRQVAVKEVTFPAAAEEELRLLRERTLREARAAARFEHPQVTTVHDVVEEDGKPWIVMEHVPSRTLGQVLRDQGPMPVNLVARIGIDLLGALQAAHRAGIVHRDVKPDNVLIDAEWRAWLTDFGIATSSGDSGLTETGIMLGSPPYMAPERARNEKPGPAADMWSLGATLFTAVEGRPPFDRGEAMATLLAVTSDPPAPMAAAGALTPVLMGCLIKDPAQRMTAEQAEGPLESAATTPTGESVPPPRALPQYSDGSDHATRVERLDLAELSALAKTAATTLAGRAARKAASSVSARLQDRSSSRPEPPTPPRQDAAVKPRWRFRRRWVFVPLLIAFAVVIALIVLGLYLFGALGDALSG